MKKINVPNALSLFRMALVPVIVCVMLVDFDGADWISLVLFAVASLTDFVDGYIARKYHLVTNIGKLLDPLADKMMVTSVLLILVWQDRLHVIPVIIIVVRELAITGLRAVAASTTKGELVIPASIWGKMKTISQMLTIIILLVDNRIMSITSFPVSEIMVIIMTALTIISAVEYFIKAKGCLKD